MTSFMLAAVLGAAMGGCCSAAELPPSVAIFLEFQHQPPECSVDEMKYEVDRVYRPAGLKINWRYLNSFRTGETFPEVFVVKIRGDCELRGCLLGWKEGAVTRELKPLGYAAKSDGRVLPFATIFCDRIRDTIIPSAVTLGSEPRAKMLGRALGRVLAHELYHMLTRTDHHARRGIIKPFHTRLDLVADELHFEPEQIEALREPDRELTAADGSY